MRILVLSNNDGGLYKFRKELLEKLCEDNTVICSVPESDGYIDKIEKIGCKCIRTCIDRRGKNPLKDLKLYKTYLSIIKREKPDVVLTYTIKPNIYGGIACQKSKIPYITNVTGLGTAIENGGIVSKVLAHLYKIGLKRANCIFFQNSENKSFFEKKGVVSNKTRLIPGSGVNTSAYSLEAYPEDGEEFRFLFVGRIMKDKGIEELLKAFEIVHKKWEKASLDIVGYCDEDYSEQIEKFEKEGCVKYHGKQSEVHAFYKRAHCVVLPSYHEGMANVLLEAESTGRPVIASRIPGCQETFDEGITGLGCAAKDVDSLAKSMEKMLTMTWDSRKKMGLLGREKVSREFERTIVVNAYAEEIEKAKKSI